MSQITITNVNKAFGDKEILRGVDLKIKKGEVVCILGPSGSGKTTFLRCLNFLEKADKGVIKIGSSQVSFEQPIAKHVRELQLKTAMVFQGYELFTHMTAKQNVMEGLVTARKYSKKEAGKIALDMLNRVGMLERANYYPSQLSGGQQQRVGIARAIALSPELILFDEPTSALDPELVGEVLSVMRTLADDGQTMIIVTHEMQFAHDVADKVVFMDGGKVIEMGTSNQIFHQPQHERTKRFLSSLSISTAC